jgi:hypothetical protein
MRFAAVLVTCLCVVVGESSVASAAASRTPYRDPSATGIIGLCDRAGHQITHGNINTKPFVWRAVSSQAAASPYNEAGRTATLYAYQPRQDVASGDWSGDSLTASARYSNPAHPMAQATGGDESLKDFIGEFRPMWDGLLQLRLFLGAPDQQAYSFTYPATDIKVTGNTWQVVDGGTVACNSGSAESIETILLPKSKTATHSEGQRKPHHSSAAGPTAIAAAATAPRAGGGVNPSPSTAALESSTRSGAHATTVVGVVVAALVVLLAAGYLTTRRRRALPAGAARPSNVKETK